MAPNPPGCSFIHASMAGSRSTAPLNRSNCVLHRRSTFCFRDLWLRSTLTFPPTKIPRLEQSFLSKECSSRLTPQSFITRIVRDRFVGKSDTDEGPSVRWLDPNFVIHRCANSLFAAKISFLGHRNDLRVRGLPLSEEFVLPQPCCRD